MVRLCEKLEKSVRLIKKNSTNVNIKSYKNVKNQYLKI